MHGLEYLILTIVLGLLLSAAVLPIVALVIAIVSKRRVDAQVARLASLQQLFARVERIEAALSLPSAPIAKVPEPPPQKEQPAAPPVIPPPFTPPPITAPPIPQPKPPPPAVAAQPVAADLESIIGRRWVGWIAIGLILFATAFFLKYAFDNRWIGELGRVAIGIIAGLTLTLLGFRFHRRRWRIFSQILTAGGIVLLYVSVYAAFGYYHLVTQRAAFVYLLILIAEAAALAVLYDARAIAVMALIGGFLTPILLRSDRDQYRTLFGYIAALDVGALALPKRWIGINSIAFAGTHLLYWSWYAERYHPRKLGAVLTFQTGIFLIFLLAPLGRRLIKREPATIEDLCLLPINAFFFFATAFDLLDPDYGDWMGVFAVGMALIYAGVAKILVDRKATSRGEVFTMISVTLVFVTIAIPIQFERNWITIAWTIEALTVLWTGLKIRSTRLQALSFALFALALGKLVLWDTPYGSRAIFTPVLNKYFLSSLAVTALLFAASALLHRSSDQEQPARPNLAVLSLLIAIGTLWWIMSIETYTYFRAQAWTMKDYEDVRHQLWLGQMALSVLWSVYAAVLAAVGFIRRSAAVRWAALGLFGLTVGKVMLVDIAQLRQLYRIIAFLVLGVLLLIVAWGYHKAFRSKESQK